MVATGTAVETSAPKVLATKVVIKGAVSRFRLDGLPGGFYAPGQINLAILDPVQNRAPCAIRVTVTGCDPWATVTFSVGGDDIWVTYANFEGAVNEVSLNLPGDLAAGVHALVATSDVNGSDTEDFTLLNNPRTAPIDVPDIPVEVVPDSLGKWVFQDAAPAGIGSWTMEYNPSTMTAPQFERTVNTRHTTSANNGRFTVGEGVFVGKPWKLSGTYLDQDYYDNLVKYASLRRRIYVIDHRGRAWKVGIAALTVEPRRVPDWIGSWTMDLIIYDRAPVEPV